MALPHLLRAALWLAVSSLPALAHAARGQTQPTEITAAQNTQAPYLHTGRLSVIHGRAGFFGTATWIRRYTGLTCGHLLYNEETGFSTGLHFAPHYYLRANADASTVAQFGVLSGYQAASDVNGDSDAAFARDLGYVLFVKPAPSNDWADWAPNPDALLQSRPRLILGYAAETYPGDVMASVLTSAPFSRLEDGLYESTEFYTQSGMSGGPLLLLNGASWQVIAETVAGTSPPGPALSDVRAITAEARELLIQPEYQHGLVRGGSITGASTVTAGATGTYKCGVIFADGLREGAQLPRRYAELKLKAAGPNKAAVQITRVKTGKYLVNFGGLSPGQSVVLRLLRDTLPNGSQTPLAQFTVTAQ